MDTTRSASPTPRSLWKTAALCLCAVAASGLLLAAAQPAGPRVIGVCGGDKVIYRVYDDGRVDYLVTERAPSSSVGSADWARLPIDPNLTRDSQRNVTPKKP